MPKENQQLSAKKIITIVISLLIIVFALQNIEMTEVKFLFWKVRVSRVLIILGSFILGVLIGGYVKKWLRKTNNSPAKSTQTHPWKE